MSLDRFASADGTPPKVNPTPAGPQETDEDLFNFDELSAASAKATAAMKKELDEALDTVDAAKKEVASTIPPPQNVAPPAPASAPVAPPPLRPPTAATGAPSLAAPVATTTVVHQKLTMSPFAGALLGAVVIANVALLYFAVQSVNATKALVRDVATEVRETTDDLRDESSRRTELAAFQSEPVFGALPEGYRTLELARDRIAKGEHARARRMLFGLLAVIDRLQQPARSEVEAQAGFLIADSLRLEAQALAETQGVQR